MSVEEFKNREHALACKEKCEKSLSRMNLIVMIIGIVAPILIMLIISGIAELFKLSMSVGLFMGIPLVFDIIFFAYTGTFKNAVKFVFLPFTKAMGIPVIIIWLIYASFVVPFVYALPSIVLLVAKKEMQQTIVSAEEYLSV